MGGLRRRQEPRLDPDSRSSGTETATRTKPERNGFEPPQPHFQAPSFGVRANPPRRRRLSSCCRLHSRARSRILLCITSLPSSQAEFEANPGGPSKSGAMPEAGTPTAAGSTETVTSAEALETSEAEVAASLHHEGTTPDGAIPRLQNAFWAAPVGLTFSWQASSWQTTPSPVQPTASDEPSKSLMADATADDVPDSIAWGRGG